MPCKQNCYDLFEFPSFFALCQTKILSFVFLLRPQTTGFSLRITGLYIFRYTSYVIALGIFITERTPRLSISKQWLLSRRYWRKTILCFPRSSATTPPDVRRSTRKEWKTPPVAPPLRIWTSAPGISTSAQAQRYMEYTNKKNIIRNLRLLESRIYNEIPLLTLKRSCGHSEVPCWIVANTWLTPIWDWSFRSNL